VIEPPEECDDHNLTSGDGCDANCTTTRCGNGIVTAGEDCDDGNTVNCDSCPKDCKTTTAPEACTSTTVRYAQHIHLAAPEGAVLSGGVFCIDYPSGVVALPGHGNIATGGTNPRLTNAPSGSFLNDFNNAVQLSFVTNPGQPSFDPSISFDLCTGQAAPSATAFVCVTKSASSNGQTLDTSTVECTPMTP
jgi:cysteine-rich repeat protein